MILKSKYKYFKEQDKAITNIKTSSAKYHLLRIGRGGGKTITLLDLILHYSLSSIEDILVVSKTIPQVKKLFTQLEERLKHISKLVSSINKSDRTISFYNGSKVVFKGGERPDNLRGQNEHTIVICDEFAFFHPETWDMALRQICGVKKVKKVIIASTPKGYNSFYHLCLEARSGNNNYVEYHYTVESNPYGQQVEDIESARKNMPLWKFNQEYLAEFITDGIGVFTNIESVLCLDKGSTGVNNYAGIDIGLTSDYTVITILNDKKEEVAKLRFNQREDVDSARWLQRVEEFLKKHNVKRVLIENNYEKTLVADLKKSCNKLGIKYNLFTTTNSSKIEIIEDLLIAFDNLQLKLLKDSTTRDELSLFVKKDTSLSYTYQASSGHDDTVMSLALAYKCVKTYSGSSLKVIDL